MIRTRTIGEVGAMIPSRLCCCIATAPLCAGHPVR